MGLGFDPYANLALEELLVQSLADDEAVLYLWQNQHTVVIGRHQNAHRECRVERLEADGGRLARRLSGGGAVYHDLGNLNFTFLVPGRDYDLTRQLGVILSAVRTFGIDAAFSGRNDILANGRKFSGNAFYHGRHASFHHGTILVNVDTGVMSDYLNVPAAKMADKGVSSVQSRVVNLVELVPSLTVDAVKEAMVKAFIAEYGGDGERVSAQRLTSTPAFAELQTKYQSFEWRIGKSPAFDVVYDTRFPWGGIEIGFVVGGGIVREVRIYSDAMDTVLIEDMQICLHGAAFDKKALSDTLMRLGEDRNSDMMADVAAWLKMA
jgi:lipoate-protein ligase A